MNMVVLYSTFFILGAAISFVVTPLIIRLASSQSIVSTSRFGELGKKNIPLLGGVSIFISFAIVSVISIVLFDIDGVIKDKNIIGMLLGGVIIIVGGFFDDRFRLRPHVQIIWPFIAAVVVIASGVGITHITNPITPDELIYLDIFHTEIITFQGMPYFFDFPADMISFVWLVLIMYATKLQDGLDGLVTGVSLIAALFIFMLSYFLFLQFDLALLAIIFAGVLTAFLFFNRYPARIYLGEGGSLFSGFVLGSFAVVSDAKVVITLIIFAIPILDTFWTVLRRLIKKQKPWIGDSEHIHHMLVHKGISHKRAVYILYAITALFGMLVFLWQSTLQYYFTGLASIILLTLAIFFRWAYNQKSLDN